MPSLSDTCRPTRARRGRPPGGTRDYGPARELFEAGFTTYAIGKQLGLPKPTIAYRAKVEGWRRLAVRTPKRRCWECQQITFTAPCGHCGA